MLGGEVCPGGTHGDGAPHTEMLILGRDSIQERQTTLLGSEIHIDARWELSGKMVDVSAPRCTLQRADIVRTSKGRAAKSDLVARGAREVTPIKSGSIHGSQASYIFRQGA
jgi:hypothetical protein